ncbi:MAG: heavy-metal-associated domain-containing protein [Fibrobacter sp.]|nr:heavy-metal-associated domain-containing protein [Fibrobacter sp.]
MLKRFFKKNTTAKTPIHDWHISSMSCHHCAGRIDAILKNNRVKKYRIDIKNRRLQLFQEVDVDKIKEILATEGYQAD